MAIGLWVCPSCLAVLALSTFLIPSVCSSRIHLPGSRNSTPITGASSLVEPLVPGSVTLTPLPGFPHSVCVAFFSSCRHSSQCPTSFAYVLQLNACGRSCQAQASPIFGRLARYMGPKRVYLYYGPRIHLQMLPTRPCSLAVSFGFWARTFAQERTFTSLTSRPLGRTKVLRCRGALASSMYCEKWHLMQIRRGFSIRRPSRTR